MKIERASISHLNDVTNLFNEYRVFYEQPSDVKSAKAFIEDRLHKKDSVIFVASAATATTTAKSVGFTQLYPTFSSVSMKRLYILNDLFVVKDARGEGVGTALLKHAQDFAINEEGCKGLALATATDNLVAQILYEQLGFVKDETFYHYDWIVPPGSSSLN